MSLEIVSFIFGGLLILLGILGGDFELKEFKVPQIKGFTRLMCLAGGSFFIFLGIALEFKDYPGSAPQSSNKENSRLVYFTIRNQLGEAQISEQVRVIIDDKPVGSITVSSVHPSSEISIAIPQEGRYSYQLSVTAYFLDEKGNPFEYSGLGSGYINVYSGKVFSITGQIIGNTWQAWLEETY